MRALRLATALALLLAPIAGCLAGEERVTLDGEEPGPPCAARIAWTQAGIFEQLAARTEPSTAREGLAVDPSAAGLPEGTQLHGLQWEPGEDADLEPARFSVSSPRWSEDEAVVMLEARLLSDHEDQARPLAERFVDNLTDAPPETVKRTASKLLDNDVASFTSADPDGPRTPVTLYRVDHEIDLAAEELLAGFDEGEHPTAGAELDDLSLSAGEWRLWGEVPIAYATAPVADPYAQLTANPFDEVAVEIPVEDPDELPTEDLVNETFAHLGLPDPEPETWSYEDTCGVDVERPNGSTGNAR